jgi:hypothetical protein
MLDYSMSLREQAPARISASPLAEEHVGVAWGLVLVSLGVEVFVLEVVALHPEGCE